MQEEHFLDPFWKHLRPFLLSVQFLMFDEATWNEHILVPVLARWLRWPRPDGQPRYFYVRWNANQCSPLIRLLREVGASQPSKICQHFFQDKRSFFGNQN
jgi:hypothetical protein